MLDVLHYLLDEDLAYRDLDGSNGRATMRVSLYKHLLDKEYKYAPSKTSSTRDFGADDSLEDYRLQDLNMSKELKPYIPPTNIDPNADNPFQGILREAPLG